MPRYFTVEQAQQVLPEIESNVRRLASARSMLEELEEELRAAGERITLLGGSLVDRQKLRASRTRREALAMTLKEAVEAIQQHGCVVKDLALGLVDFPTLFQGEEVYLCWKLGEERIGFWHGLEEGFRGRKPIDREFLDHHRGEG